MAAATYITIHKVEDGLQGMNIIFWIFFEVDKIVDFCDLVGTKPAAVTFSSWFSVYFLCF